MVHGTSVCDCRVHSSSSCHGANYECIAYVSCIVFVCLLFINEMLKLWHAVYACGHFEGEHVKASEWRGKCT
jgi:hypothetical protein